MGDNYIPAEDGLALTWMQTFSAGITANFAAYQLTAADATNISDTVADFATAYAVALAPATRTMVTVAAKDSARNIAEQLCRQYAILIKYNAGITDPDKIAIGVRPVNNSREPINVPESSPLLNIIGATPSSHTLRFADTATPDSAAKPFGATQLQLFVAVGEAAVSDPEAAAFYAAVTKNPVGVEFEASQAGKVATYFGRWASRKGETGPWSLPVSMNIAA